MRGTYRIASNRFGVSSVGHKMEKTKNEKGTLVVRYFSSLSTLFREALTALRATV
jgi:hypothetical protein